MKIEPFKMRVTPEQSRRVQEIIFENGGEWRDGQTTAIKTNCPCLAFELHGDGDGISAWSDPFVGSPTFLNAKVPEIMYYQFINKYVKQMKTYKIPENTREISVNETDGRIVIEFVPEDPEFKEGDIVCGEAGNPYILKNMGAPAGDKYYAWTCGGRVHYNRYAGPAGRLATPAEAQQLFDALAKDGKRWNPDTLKIEELTERDSILKFLQERYADVAWRNHGDIANIIEYYLEEREAQSCK